MACQGPVMIGGDPRLGFGILASGAYYTGIHIPFAGVFQVQPLECAPQEPKCLVYPEMTCKGVIMAETQNG